MAARRPTDQAQRPGANDPSAVVRAAGARARGPVQHDGQPQGGLQAHSGADAAVGDESAAQLLDAIREPLRGDMSLFAFRGFLEPLRPGTVAMDDDGTVTLTILAPSSFLADWVTNHYGVALAHNTAGLLGRTPNQVQVRIIERPASTMPPTTLLPTAADVAPEPLGYSPLTHTPNTPSWSKTPAAAPRAARSESVARGEGARGEGGDVVALNPGRGRARVQGRRLDPRYTFDSFVVGAGSRMAYSASVAVAERPGARYSPLFIFGPTGMGKTHLLHAVGHEILARHPQHRVALLSAEQWVNEFIESAHDKAFDAFRRRFRDDVDVLLVDDIQFLAGKAQSQDEFFHTFNALYEGHKQIVVTSDRYPHEIAGLEDRLKTRFQWGLVADVRPPDADTRRQILARKAVDLGCALPTDVLDFVASSITTSVRALEGALTRLVAWSQLTREPLSLDEAKEQLRPSLSAGAASPLSVGRIIDVVATYHGMRAKDLMGPTRQRQVTRARQIAMFLARRHLQMSFPELGRAFGGRDHTTVLASVSKIEGARADDTSLQALLTRLEQTLF